jgi:hypothetical protein
MPVSDLHRQIAALALAAAREHGFALGGGNALLAPRGHLRAYPGRRLVHRPGPWRPGCRRRRGGRAARRGLRTRAARPGGRAHRHLPPGMGEGLAEWIVTAPAGEQMALQLAYSGPGPRAGHHGHRPGPGHGRRRSREGVRAGQPHRAAGLRGRGRCAAVPASQSGLPGGWDPGLACQDFADAGLRLDQMKDTRFADVGLSQADVTALRARFAGWPETPKPSTGNCRPGTPPSHSAGPGTARAPS